MRLESLPICRKVYAARVYSYILYTARVLFLKRTAVVGRRDANWCNNSSHYVISKAERGLIILRKLPLSITSPKHSVTGAPAQ